MEFLLRVLRSWGLALLWDVLLPDTPTYSTIWEAPPGPLPHHRGQAVAMKFSASFTALTIPQVTAPTSNVFGAWPPRWYLDAVNQMEAMVRDGARAPELMLALISAVSGRGSPPYTAFATPVLTDIAEHFQVLAPACLPTGHELVPHGSHSFTFQGAMTRDRVDDWVRYVEYNILLEFLVERYPQHVREWNTQTAARAPPTTPVQPWTGDTTGLDVFNAIISQGPVGPQNRPQPLPPNQTWAAQVVRDIRHFHSTGYRIGGLVQAIGVYVDGRGYGAHTNYAYRQLHVVSSLVGDMHNLTTSVPPSHFNAWASNREQQLWRLSRSQARAAPTWLDSWVLQGMFCAVVRRPLWCSMALVKLIVAQPGGAGAPAEGDNTFPLWMVTVVRTMGQLQTAGVSGADALGLLRAVAHARNDVDYARFADRLVEIMQILSGTPTVGEHPGVFQAEIAELAEFGERHILAENLADRFGRELLMHEALLDRGMPTSSPLPEIGHENATQRGRRLRYNQLREVPPLLQQLQARPLPPVDPRGHRLTWTGEVVQQTFDYFSEGYHTGAVEALLRQCVAERNLREYEARASLYIQEAVNQLADYTGACWTSPEGLSRWAQDMERQLWEAYTLHGLDLHGCNVPPDDSASASSSGSSITGDEHTLMQRPKDKWLHKGSPVRRRRARDSGRTHTDTSRTPRGDRLPRCTRETRNLAEAVRDRHNRHNGTSRPTPKAKARPSEAREVREPRHPPTGAERSSGSDRGVTAGPERSPPEATSAAPITLDMAVDTWMLALGLRSIDEDIGHTFLPRRTIDSLGATFLDHSLQDRQTLMLAMHRLVLGLLSAMGEAARAATLRERDDNPGAETGGDDDEDDVMWMQLPATNDWIPLVAALQAELEGQHPQSKRRLSEWLLDWLDHRCTDSQHGYFLGHMTGRPAEITAMLVTFAGEQSNDDWGRCTEDEIRWSMAWAQRLQGHLPLHPGSRQARGLAPERAPVMLSLRPVPHHLLHDDVAQELHGDLPAAELDRVVAVNSSGPGTASEDPSQVRQDDAVVEYLAGLRTPSSSPQKQRAVVMEVSSGSGDVPVRALRLPLPAEGEVSLHIRLWTETEVDQDGIATQPVPAVVGPAARPVVPGEIAADATHVVIAPPSDADGATATGSGVGSSAGLPVPTSCPVGLPWDTQLEEEDLSSGNSLFDDGDPAPGH